MRGGHHPQWQGGIAGGIAGGFRHGPPRRARILRLGRLVDKHPHLRTGKRCQIVPSRTYGQPPRSKSLPAEIILLAETLEPGFFLACFLSGNPDAWLQTCQVLTTCILYTFSAPGYTTPQTSHVRFPTPGRKSCAHSPARALWGRCSSGREDQRLPRPCLKGGTGNGGETRATARSLRLRGSSSQASRSPLPRPAVASPPEPPPRAGGTCGVGPVARALARVKRGPARSWQSSLSAAPRRVAGVPPGASGGRETGRRFG